MLLRSSVTPSRAAPKGDRFDDASAKGSHKGRQVGSPQTSRQGPASRWSARVTRDSDALDLKSGVFRLKDPKKIAASLRRSAQRSTRRKSTPYRSALSMLTFYINRAGRNLPEGKRKTLQRAKDERRRLFKRA
jgi:hypothetical protein